MEAYELTEEDLHEMEDDLPCIRAARNPNPAVLSAILAEGARREAQVPVNTPRRARTHFLDPFSPNAYIAGSIYGIYTSPLVEAIKAVLPDNVDILLKEGADPNGILLEDLDEYSVRFIRGRDPKYNMDSHVMCPSRNKTMSIYVIAQPQISSLTAREIVARRKTFSRFWTEPDLPTFHFASEPARTALEVAASIGDIPLFDQMRAANPDESWWTSTQMQSQLPGTLTHSSLSVSSPIHEAIISQHQGMLRHLLSIGYSPNILPLAAPTCCFPPHMASIAFCDPPNLAAYDLLALDPRTDLTLRTPVFSIHILHIAAARLDIPLLRHLCSAPTTPLSAAGSTALGHTLLHIAALPRTDAQVNLISPMILHSVHDVRTLDTRKWYAPILRQRHRTICGILFSRADTAPFPREFTSEDEADQKKQHTMVLWLLDSGTQDLAGKDVYGNTPLHYLASAVRVNEKLIAQLRASESGEKVWKESRNERGYSPEDLFKDGNKAQVLCKCRLMSA
ncbi:hypothetical protein GALMADRAFT_257111 [Galerina marginata CBS 339.88]|uniref:Ankyrin repeat protein n=1 Tax=Galerina marginata (strain CBS 339.88) TaxID=685588 RepID=A0A067SEK7_GALM3|nr:hypothetical protein GALMADRAFT_257111 [Galerina marginata CBS 339.88]